MKQKEKWAEEFRTNGAGPSDTSPNCLAFKYAAWLAGFEFAKNELDRMFSEIREANDRMKIATILPKDDHAILSLGEDEV